MIARLKGKLDLKKENWVIIDVGGVGYKVFISGQTLSKLGKEGTPVDVFCHLYVREDTQNLYGFLVEEELELFELLIGVSGVGPKAALGILSVDEVIKIKKSIFNGRSDLLMGVSGVGKKMAERVILELKGKIDDTDGVILRGKTTPEDEDVIVALQGLGYTTSEIKKAFAKIPDSIESPEEKIKQALKMLGAKK